MAHVFSGRRTGACIWRRHRLVCQTRAAEKDARRAAATQDPARGGRRARAQGTGETLRRCLPDALRLLVPESPRVRLTSSLSPLASTIVDLVHEAHEP
jgi:hypothetical protein